MQKEEPHPPGANQPHQLTQLLISGTKLKQLHYSWSPHTPVHFTAECRRSSSLRALWGIQGTDSYKCFIWSLCTPKNHLYQLPSTCCCCQHQALPSWLPAFRWFNSAIHQSTSLIHSAHTYHCFPMSCDSLWFTMSFFLPHSPALWIHRDSC